MFTSQRLLLGMTALAIAGLSFEAKAQEAVKDAGPQKESKNLSRLEQHEMAASTNFAKAFGLPYESLTTIGSRIDQARRTPDPISLASAANELMIAEKVSGKKAPLTSQELMKEAVDLGSVRFISLELRALSLMVADAAAQSRLDSLADLSKKHESDKAMAQKNKEVSKGVNGWLHVNNFTDDYLTIYVDGQQVGFVPPHTNAFRLTYINDNPYIPTELHATGPWGRSAHRSVGEVVTADFPWTISY